MGYLINKEIIVMAAIVIGFVVFTWLLLKLAKKWDDDVFS